MSQLSALPAVNDRLLFQDQAPSGTGGPAYVSSAWRTVALDTEVIDSGNIGSLAANQITLAAGTYLFNGDIAGVGGSAGCRGRLRLYNVTDAVAVVQGTSSGDYAAGENVVLAVSGSFTIAAQKTFELQVYPNGAISGAAAVSSGENEVYATLRFHRVAV